MRAVSLCCLLSILIGCQAPATNQVLGTLWESKETAELNGWWKNNESQLARASQTKDGRVVLAFLNREQDEVGFAVVNLYCTFTRLGDHSFVFATGPGVDRNTHIFGFALITSCENNRLTVAYPSDGTFLELVNNGKLSGEIQSPDSKIKRSPLITASEKEFLTVIESIGIEKCFDLKTPREFTRIVTTSD